jgi:8-oxo-dGTP pyrophosphatase MutT (NUDIX family)
MLEGRLREALGRGAAAHLSGDHGIDLDISSAAVPAAVLIAITDRPSPGLILTQRPETMRRHPGQVAFPGGRVDVDDEDHIAAALREAEEEIALPPSQVRVIGSLSSYRTGTGYDITPVIGLIPPDLRFIPNSQEVASIFEVPLAFVLDPANRTERVGIWQGQERRFYELSWGGYRIWGATAGMLVNLERILSW